MSDIIHEQHKVRPMNSSFGTDVKSGLHTSRSVERMLSWRAGLALMMLVSFLNEVVDSNAI